MKAKPSQANSAPRFTGKDADGYRVLSDSELARLTRDSARYHYAESFAAPSLQRYATIGAAMDAR